MQIPPPIEIQFIVAHLWHFLQFRQKYFRIIKINSITGVSSRHFHRFLEQPLLSRPA